MKKILQLEEIAMTAIGIYFLSVYNLHISVWLWIFIFFTPDLGMLGYLISPKAGAISYNILHHKGIAVGLMGAGYFMKQDLLLTTGILLFAHSSFDRALGYGLKYYSSFNDTHLGKLKKDVAV